MSEPTPEQNAQRIERMRELLDDKLAPVLLEIKDDSGKHHGHAGAQGGLGHFSMSIASEKFRNVSPLQRHKLVYDALGDMMQTDIHALSIRALTPDQVAKQ